MKTIKVNSLSKVPKKFTGKIELANENFFWFKDGKRHREDGPSFIVKDGYKAWRLNGQYIWNSTRILNLRNQIILSKTQHPEYPTVQIWKILDEDKVWEQIVIPGMEEFITE